MLCLPETTTDSDCAVWLERAEFERLVNVDNFLCRDAQYPYLHAYCNEWFREAPVGGLPRFELPTIYSNRGRIEFINGRHRTAVLIAHRNVLPFAVAVENVEAAGAAALLARCTAMLAGCPIDLPDLPLLARSDLRARADWSRPRMPTPEAM